MHPLFLRLGRAVKEWRASIKSIIQKDWDLCAWRLSGLRAETGSQQRHFETMDVVKLSCLRLGPTSSGASSSLSSCVERYVLTTPDKEGMLMEQRLICRLPMGPLLRVNRIHRILPLPSHKLLDLVRMVELIPEGLQVALLPIAVAPGLSTHRATRTASPS